MLSAKYKSFRLENKVAVITAATNGIGLAIAERLGHEGARLMVSSRNEDNVKWAVEHLVTSGLKRSDVVGCTCHVANSDDRSRLLKATIAQFGFVHILVNNAGINPIFGDLLEVDERAWDKLFDVNVKAGFMLAKLFVPEIERSGLAYFAKGEGGRYEPRAIWYNVGPSPKLDISLRGRRSKTMPPPPMATMSIIFNASIGAYRSPRGIAAYGITKTALLGLTKALAESLAPKGIRVNAIAPGIIKTKMSKALWEGNTDGRSSAEAIGTLLGRLGKPEECAALVAFLCSSDASYITGESVPVAGGAYSRL